MQNMRLKSQMAEKVWKTKIGKQVTMAINRKQ